MSNAHVPPSFFLPPKREKSNSFSCDAANSSSTAADQELLVSAEWISVKWSMLMSLTLSACHFKHCGIMSWAQTDTERNGPDFYAGMEVSSFLLTAAACFWVLDGWSWNSIALHKYAHKLEFRYLGVFSRVYRTMRTWLQEAVQCCDPVCILQNMTYAFLTVQQQGSPCFTTELMKSSKHVQCSRAPPHWFRLSGYC